MIRCLCAAGVVALALALGACKHPETVWFGSEITADGDRIQLAAEEPLCGCITLANKSGRDLKLRASMRDVTVGTATLKAGESLRTKFDWAGSENDDLYYIDVAEATGRHTAAKGAIELDQRSKFEECQVAQCPYGSLLMNAAAGGK
jgi:hypothetical protein